ncbi:MAG TPA: serine/threonine-protein kinase [Gemmataceae bacterium]|nr:serine/threonine-protein kinase [Gemmataceae bacterium]
MPDLTAAKPDTESRLLEARAALERGLASGTLRSADDLRDTFPDLWADDDAALELVYAEYVWRAGRGENPQSDDWYRRYPTWRDRLERLFALYGLIGAADTGRTDRLITPAVGLPPAVVGDGYAAYDLYEELGRGGMGVVYRARQVDLNRVVAVKMLRGGSLARGEDAARFRREAEAAARLQHPNIVQIFEVGEFDGAPFLSLEFVGGGSLEDELGRSHRQGLPAITPTAAALLVETLARATQYAHEQGVIHRDLKPANVLLAGEESSRIPKITDFGLATIAEGTGSETKTGAVLGTPSYMAPEQAAGDRAAVGPRADVYALGGILYRLLAGRPPFEGATPLETIDLVRTTDPVSPTQLRPTVPRDVETICLKCLHKDPGRRYASAADLADDLVRFLRGEPVRARRVTAIERGVKWARRRPMVAGLAVTVAALAAIAFILVWAKYRAAEEARATEERQRLDLVRTLAAERLALARAHWRGLEIDAAKSALAEVPELYRDEEWLALRDQCHAEVSSVNLPMGYAGRVVVSPDARRLALYAQNGTGVLVLDALTGKQLKAIPTGACPASVAFVADGDSLVVLPNTSPAARNWYRSRFKREASDNAVVWDLKAMRVTGEWALDSAFPVGLSEDGGRAASFLNLLGYVTDARTGERVANFPVSDPVRRVAIDRRGHRLAAVRSNAIDIWDVTTRRVIRMISTDGDTIMESLSPDGRVFVAGTTIPDPSKPAKDLSYRLVGWDVDDGHEIFRLVVGSVPGHARFSPDARLFACQDVGIISLFDSRTGGRVATLRGHSAFVYHLAFSPDGRRLYSVGANFVLKTWNVEPWMK